MPRPPEYTIGEFSRITRITVKALRFYQEKGLLAPARQDPLTGYRYYNGDSLEWALAVKALKELGFTLGEIQEALAGMPPEEEMLPYLKEKPASVREDIRRRKELVRRLDSSISQIQTQENSPMNDSETTVIDKTLPTRLAVCYRFTGRYPEIGKHIGKVFRTAGGKADGPPFCLYHDGEYREEDADIEIALPVKQAVPVRTPGVEIREIPGGPALTLIHTGPYTTLTSSYRRLMDALKERGLSPLIPSREVYLKGPGLIFRGNPAKYRTEIQMPYEPSASRKER